MALLQHRLSRVTATPEAGVSLVELLVFIMLTSVLGGVLGSSLVTGMRVTTQTQGRFDGLAELQMTVDRMSRELRAADPVLFTASDATTAVVEIYRDPPAFTQTVRYTYKYCGGQRRIHVLRESPPPVTITPIDCLTSSAPVMIDDIENGATPVFSYLTQAGTPATTQEDVFRLKVTLRRLVPDGPIEVTTAVRVRNAR